MERHYWSSNTDKLAIEKYIIYLNEIGYTILFVIPTFYNNGKLELCSIITTEQKIK